MTEPILGSVEILTHDNQNIGVVGVRWTVEAVPVVLETLHGITELAPVEPQEQPTGRTPEAQWAGVDQQNQPVTVFLWKDVPHDETVIAQAIAHAIAETEHHHDGS